MLPYFGLRLRLTGLCSSRPAYNDVLQSAPRRTLFDYLSNKKSNANL